MKKPKTRTQNKKGILIALVIKLAFVLIVALFLILMWVGFQSDTEREAKKYRLENLLVSSSNNEKIAFVDDKFGSGVGDYVSDVVRALRADPTDQVLYTFPPMTNEAKDKFVNTGTRTITTPNGGVAVVADPEARRNVYIQIVNRDGVLDVFVIDRDSNRQELFATGDVDPLLRKQLCFLPLRNSEEFRHDSRRMLALGTLAADGVADAGEDIFDYKEVLERNTISRLELVPGPGLATNDAGVDTLVGDSFLVARYTTPDGVETEAFIGDGSFELFTEGCTRHCKYLLLNFEGHSCFFNVGVRTDNLFYSEEADDYVHFDQEKLNQEFPEYVLVGGGPIEKEAVRTLVQKDYAIEPPSTGISVIT